LQREYTLISSTSVKFLTNNQSKVSLSKRWKNESQIFWNELFKNDESMPFGQPVDVNQFPDY
jgi:hypothetical protein